MTNSDGQEKLPFVWILFVPAGTPQWVLARQEVEKSGVTLLTGLDPVLEAALSGAIPADLRSFAASLGLRSYLLTSPNEVVSALQNEVALPKAVYVLPQVILLYLWIVELTVIEHFGRAWGPAQWTGGAEPPAGSFFVPGPGTIRVFGGSQGNSVPGRDLAQAGTAWAKTVEANNHLGLIFETADEALSFKSVRCALLHASGIGGACAEWTGAGGIGQLKTHMAGTNAMAPYAGITYYLRTGVKAGNIAGAPFGAGAIAAVGPAGAPVAPAIAKALVPGWPPATPQELPSRLDLINYTINYVAMLGATATQVEAEQFAISRAFGVPGAVFGAGGYAKARLQRRSKKCRIM